MPTKKNRAGEQQPYKSSDGEYTDYESSSSKTEATQQDAKSVEEKLDNQISSKERINTQDLSAEDFVDWLTKKRYNNLRTYNPTKDLTEKGRKNAKQIEVGKWYQFPAESLNQANTSYGKVVAITTNGQPIVEKHFELPDYRPGAPSKWYDTLPLAINADEEISIAPPKQNKNTEKYKVGTRVRYHYEFPNPQYNVDKTGIITKRVGDTVWLNGQKMGELDEDIYELLDDGKVYPKKDWDKYRSPYN